MNTLMKKSNGNGNLPATSFSGLVDNIFQKNLNRFFDDEFWGFDGLSRNASAPVNLRETDKAFEMEVVAPGLKKEDFRLNVTGDRLSISCEHQEENNQENKEEGWLRREFRKRSFTRFFDLEDTIDTGKITAQYHNGILHVTLPKKEGAQRIARTIEIK